MFPFIRSRSQKKHSKTSKAGLSYESLEVRNVLSTFSVINLNDSGAGSLRQAILDSNSTAGADVISFSVAGSIQLTGALPALTDEVDIDGTTAPGYSGTPLVELDFNGARGLHFNSGASNSELRSLALVDAGGAGVKLNAVDGVVIVGNYIGIGLNGEAAANRGHGVELVNASGNVIGGESATERNIISSNRKSGIHLNSSNGNVIDGNYIGTNADGTLDFGNHSSGIRLKNGSSNNIIGKDAGNVISGNDVDGVYITGGSSLNRMNGNRIGTNAAGTAALGNSRDGIKIEKADGNLIGNLDLVYEVTYANADDVPTQPVTAWQGIRATGSNDEYLIVGTSNDDGLLFQGSIEGVGDSYLVQYPGAMATSVYGPDDLGGNQLRLVGTYRNADYLTAPVTVNGFLFEGTIADLGTPANHRTINYPGAKYTYVHSTMGGMVVGNYDNPAEHNTHGLPLGPGHAFIYDIASDTFLTDVVFPGSLSNTAYGIWHNGGSSYTIVGGYSNIATNNLENPGLPIGSAFMVDYDSVSGLFTNWQSFNYPEGLNIETHFEGISSVENGVYTLNADSLQLGIGQPAQGSWVRVQRNGNGSFGEAIWVDLNYEGLNPVTNVTSSNSVMGNQVVGLVIGSSPFSFQATINTTFELSNVISGNGANGITLHEANDNRIARNYIGTDVSGTIDLGNGGNGIQLKSRSSDNKIGGEESGGNNPTMGAFARPPLGNLISGNDANGVFIHGKSTGNQLSGNFIGTDSSGNAALGNTLDGVAIENANGNSLIGCTATDDPFVFYNVISANGGNGLRVKSANDTTIQANFFGIGADNDTALGNQSNGVLIEGSSTRTVMGGPIPLGNVVAANVQNGIVVQDKSSEFTSYNTFCGLAAFSLNPTLGNGQDGMLITTTGKNILIRTNVITRNGDDGIEVSGKAKDVRIAGNIIGLNTNGLVPMGNADNGVEVGGKARDIVVGGPQPTFNIIPRNTIGSNGGHGVAIVGSARDTIVSEGYIGTDITGLQARGNGQAGVYLGAGTFGTTIGSPDPTLLTVISGNTGNGVEMRDTYDNTVINSYIGVAADGISAMGNGGNGILIADGSYDNFIGSTTNVPANKIASNSLNGVFVESGTSNGILGNSIFDNTMLGIKLADGANLNQEAPVLSSLQIVGLNLQITGTLTSLPRTTYLLQFFANEADEASGQFLLGSLNVTTSSAGEVEFTFTGPLPPLGADFITATATDPDDNTSEFSVAIS